MQLYISIFYHFAEVSLKTMMWHLVHLLLGTFIQI